MLTDLGIAVIAILVATIAALVGIAYRALSVKIDAKVDKELYIQTIQSIQKAVDGINGTATMLKSVVENVANIHKDFLTIKEHDYICRLRTAELKLDNGKTQRSPRST